MLINNAGIVSGQHTQDLTDAMIDRTLQVNTISHLHTIKEFLPDMIANRKGHIVTIASMAGLACVAGLTDYCASKYGAVAIDESLRLELKKNGHYSYSINSNWIWRSNTTTSTTPNNSITFPRLNFQER